MALRGFISAEGSILNYSFGEFEQFENRWRGRGHCMRAIFVKSEFSRSLPLIYCKAKIVVDSLFVNVFHAVAVRTTILFLGGIPCQNH